MLNSVIFFKIMLFSAILVFVILAISVWYFLFKGETGLPPGPRGYPFIGNVLDFLGRDIRDVLMEYRQAYGDIFTVRVFNQVFIICNGHKMLKDVFVKQGDVFSARPVNQIRLETNTGHGFWGPPESQLWKSGRRFCLRTLKEFGMGRNIMQLRVHDEVKFFLEAIDRYDGQPFNINSLLYAAVANVICDIVIGKRFSYDDPVFCEMIQIMCEVSNTNYLLAFPFFRKIPGDPFHIARFYKNRKFLAQKFRNIIDEHEEIYAGGQPDNLVDAYIAKMRQPSPETEADDMNKNELVNIIESTLEAGTDTTSNTLLFGLAYLLHNQSVQNKLRCELDKTIPPDRLPGMEDKLKLPFMEATILEILRRSCVVPLGVPHAATVNASINGYNIPKGTSVLPVLHSVLMDKRLWTDPECFRPNRFLNTDGTVNRMEELIPFSVGKRSCLGEPLAMVELFLFLSAMLQRYEIRPAIEGELPSLEGKMALVLEPEHFLIRAIPRHRRQ